MPELLKVTYVRSAVGRSYHQKRTIRALGLRRLHRSRVFEDNPSVRGMISKVAHLLEVEPVEGDGGADRGGMKEVVDAKRKGEDG